MHRSLNKCKKKTNDNVYTPSDVVDDCMSLVDIGQFDTLLDPFYGDGAFYTKYPAINNKNWCEIEKGIYFSSIIKR